jgi:soluble lytic murein transglycosylase
MHRIFLFALCCLLIAPGSGLAQQGRAEPGLPRTANLSIADAPARAAALDARQAGATGLDLGRIRLGQGVLSYLAGDYGRSVQALEESAALASELADYASYYRGLSLYKLGMTTEALGAFQSVAGQAGPSRSPVGQAASYMVSLCLEKNGLPEQALGSLRDFLERPEASVLPYALWRAAKLSSDLGRFDKAGEYLSRLYLDLPGSAVDGQAAALAESLAAEGKISWRPYSVESLSARAFILVRRAQNEKALAEIERALVEAQGEQAAWLTYLKGKALFALRRTPAAREQFETLRRLYPDSKLIVFARLQEARAFWRSGSVEDDARMEAILLDALRQDPASEAAPLLRRFLLLERLESGRFEAALDVARDQIASGPGGRFSPETLRIAGDQIKAESRDEFIEQARYLEGLILYALGRFGEAAEKLEAFTRDWQGSQEVSGAYYWLGQASLRLSDAARAAEAFGREATLRPNSYYGFKSREIMAGANLSMPISLPAAPEAASPCPNEALGEGPTINPAARVAMERAHGLEEAWLPELAEMEIFPVAQADPANPVLALEAARIATVNGHHQAAAAAVSRAFAACLSRGGKDQLAPVRDMLYPLKYAELVRAGLEGTGIEPEFVFSLIRQESFFDPAAVSRAGAVGLMQVLPETARGLAAKLGETAPPRERLFDPAVNIRYGTAYLARKYAGLGNPVYLLCDYNAGPAKLNFWRENLGNLDPDLFTEFIPYTETRDYVRHILANMVMYRLLYQ